MAASLMQVLTCVRADSSADDAEARPFVPLHVTAVLGAVGHMP